MLILCQTHFSAEESLATQAVRVRHQEQIICLLFVFFLILETNKHWAYGTDVS